MILLKPSPIQNSGTDAAVSMGHVLNSEQITYVPLLWDYIVTASSSDWDWDPNNLIKPLPSCNICNFKHIWQSFNTILDMSTHKSHFVKWSLLAGSGTTRHVRCCFSLLITQRYQYERHISRHSFFSQGLFTCCYTFKCHLKSRVIAHCGLDSGTPRYDLSYLKESTALSVGNQKATWRGRRGGCRMKGLSTVPAVKVVVEFDI